MPEANQYTMTLNELVEMIIKKVDVHEGQWGLLLELQLGIGSYGPSPDQTFPGAAVTIRQVGIQKVDANSPPPNPGAIMVDAAQINPKQKTKPKAPQT
jgi:hypothetical protein